LISRGTGKGTKVRYEADALFFLHTINAYEDGDFVVVDLCAYADAKMLDCMYVEALQVSKTAE
jgi:carotenoid isomerooxygenase